MTINKFQGKSKEEAIDKARQEMGDDVVIMNIKEIKPKGVFKVFKNMIYEVTAAVEEKAAFQNPAGAMQNIQKRHDKIDLAADDELELPKPRRAEDKTPAAGASLLEALRRPLPNPTERVAAQPQKEDKKLEERLENLSNILEKKLGETKKEEPELPKTPTSEEMNFIRILYTTLLNNEVNEKYANQLMDEVERFVRPGNGLDMLLPNVYQKLILRFGQPNTIDLSAKKPRILFFVGPTGVGKTTTIAKISSKYKVDMNKKIAFLTADTYRIAATEQLKVYANILEAPIAVVYKAEDLNQELEKLKDYELVFIDTAGFSHKNMTQKEDIKNLIQGLDPQYEKEVYLVLSATTKYKDLLEIVDIYHEIAEDYKLIFTKLDETSAYGNILNIKLYSGADLSYVTNGQNVPDDMEVFDTQKIVKQLLGGK